MSTFSCCCPGNMLPMAVLLMLLCVLMLMPEAKAAAATTTTTTTKATAGAAVTMRGLRQRPKPNNETSGNSSSSSNNNNNNFNNNNANVGSKYEIRGVAGEPNYKSVNLTWEVEFVPLAGVGTGAGAGETARHDTLRNAGDDVTNMSIDSKSDFDSSTNLLPPLPKAFQIYYCEMQNYGPQRCRVKVVNASSAELKDEKQKSLLINEEGNHIQHFSTAVDNLRMATKYSFHIKPATSPKRFQTPFTRSQNGRSEFNEENEIESLNSKHLPGQSIIIPTKGFSAHATQCLPHASEIEVETGPYFAGRIVVDGGNCGVKGDPNDPADKYTMRIDHAKCGSMVKPETNTVETFITVQENLGIFTHSTRRFVVVCSYQSGMQTVRASFMVPGKNGVAAAYEPNDPFQPDGEDDRFGREMRHMRYVNKSELVLKETDESAEQAALVVEELAPSSTTTTTELARGQQQGRALTLTSLNELNNLAEPEIETERGLPAQVGRFMEQQVGTKYAKLVVDQSAPGLGLSYNTWTNPSDHDEDNQDVYAATLRYISSNLGSILVTVSISVIIISICLILLQRRQQHRLGSKLSGNRMFSSSNISPCASAAAVSHLPHKTLPRALQHQQYQCTL